MWAPSWPLFICGCGSIFLFTKLVPLWNLQSPDKSLVSWRILFLMRFLVQKIKQYDFRNRSLGGILTSMGVEAPRERVMTVTDGRKDCGVCAIQWLIDRTTLVSFIISPRFSQSRPPITPSLYPPARRPTP
ncbi:hypothetical protein EDB89DRAFT_1354480 [Lactarius sanguifluus]|nr:hypothetical protein EDB89DRAFT_1354480 [Lactarius sanguifluus]